MRKIHRVLRLFFEAGLSVRAIARSIQASPSAVGGYIRRAKTAGLSWPLPETLDERALEGRLFPTAAVSARVERPIPDWARVHAERRGKGVTLALLWQEYKAVHPEGLQYSQFCEPIVCSGGARAGPMARQEARDRRSLRRDDFRVLRTCCARG